MWLVFVLCGGGSDEEPAGGGAGGGGAGGGGVANAPWLCFTASAASTVSTTVSYNGTVSTPVPTVEYSKDGGTTWTDFVIDDTTVSLASGEKMYIRAKTTNPAFSDGDGTGANYRTIKFVMTGGTIAASGNVMSLVDKDCATTAIPCPECFLGLFNNCAILTSPPELPATTLALRCYASMFNLCTGLTLAPELPAETLTEKCYERMFYKCTELTRAPELPATTLPNFCYERMFNGCSKLSFITVPFTSWPAGLFATSNWVDGVKPSGIFTCPAALVTAPGVAGDFNVSKVPAGWSIDNP